MHTKKDLKWLPVYVLFMAGLTAAFFALKMSFAQVNCEGMAYLENELACAVYNHFALGLALLALLAMAIPLVTRQVSHARIGTLLLLPIIIVLINEVVILVRVDCAGDAYFVNEFYCEGRLRNSLSYLSIQLVYLIPLVIGGIVALARVIGNYYGEIRHIVDTTS